MADSAAQKTYAAPSSPASILSRRTSIPSSAIMPPPNVAVSPPLSSPIDLRILSSKSSSQSYTSLKDILPSASAAAFNSPTAASPANSGYEISIRNRLVKQAAWAYLQPMSASSYSTGSNFFHRFWLRFSAANPIANSLGFIRGSIIPAIVRVIRFCICL